MMVKYCAHNMLYRAYMLLQGKDVPMLKHADCTINSPIDAIANYAQQSNPVAKPSQVKPERLLCMSL